MQNHPSSTAPDQQCLKLHNVITLPTAPELVDRVALYGTSAAEH